MIFGPRPLADALGCILAHSVRLPAGRLRKGIVLNDSHIAQLHAAGMSAVIAAQLEPGDVDENAAAAALGAALLDGTSGIRATPATTGRVNLVATTPGVVQIAPGKVTALNAVNPMITLACVAPHHQIHDGGMIGTVKIISYAVPQTDLSQACTAARGAVALAQPLGLSATLIITQIADGADESKAIAATTARLTALDATLTDVQTVPHDTSALTSALQRCDTDITLILTGSATSDAHDVGPSALRAAGGTLLRFGMPVDPGNLLFLGDLRGKPVLGLPGCARAPALNGADMVLSRLLCGVPVTSADIAAMGVGGLLKEIPTRPRPRKG